MTENEIGRIVVDAAVKVHRALGPGLNVPLLDLKAQHLAAFTG